MSDEITSGYALTRQWFEFAYENSFVKPNDAVLFLWLVELNNQLGWKKEFGITSGQCMSACGFTTYKQYKKALDHLVEWGFIKVVKKSANQYQCNIIALVKSTKAKTKALTKAVTRAQTKAKTIFIKPINTETNKPEGDSTTTIPTLEEVKKYFTENGYTDQIALKAFEYYSSTGWKDKNGKPVQNWKSKMVNVWFRDEHKSKQDLRMLLPKEQRGLNF